MDIVSLEQVKAQEIVEILSTIIQTSMIEKEGKGEK